MIVSLASLSSSVVWEGQRLPGASEDRARYAYLDLLAGTLTEHEKNLDRLIARLEEISEHLSRLGRKGKAVKPAEAERAVSERAAETLVYMKLKIDRPVEELKAIIDSLKE